MLILGAIFFIILGCLCLWGQDFLWELTRFGNRMDGVQSKRTKAWEISTYVGGFASFLMAVICIIAAIV